MPMWNDTGEEQEVPLTDIDDGVAVNFGNHDSDDDDDPDVYADHSPLSPSLSSPITTKKVIYFVRHAEATHNVKEREAIAASIAAGNTTKAETEAARRAILNGDPSLRDAPLSAGGISQVRSSGEKLSALFGGSASRERAGSVGGVSRSSSGGSLTSMDSGSNTPSPVFRRPDIVLVSPLRRALMTATEMFLTLDPPPKFLAIEALREKRTGMACDERSSVADLVDQFPHVDFSDVERGLPVVEMGEDNPKVRARGAKYLTEVLPHVEGSNVAIVSHKGWLREMRGTVRDGVESGRLRADFDVEAWDTTLYGNAEVRVAAFRWQDGEISSVISRSIDNAKILNDAAGMIGDGFEFALGPPSSGFSMFLAQRTTKVHFISVSEGEHNQHLRRLTRNHGGAAADATKEAEASMLREEGQKASDHPLFDARLTRRGRKQAAALRGLLSNRPSGGRPFTAFQLVVCSPLTRACETASIVFGNTPGTYGGIEVPAPRVVSREECREQMGKYVCDSRRPRADLNTDFPFFDFADLETENDTWHTDERETFVEIRDRAIRFLQWLSAQPERCIAVVTHAEFLRHLFGQFGDTLHEGDRTLLQRTTANCELRSIVLCSHSPTEAKDAPASTIRVPSCASMASLASLDEDA